MKIILSVFLLVISLDLYSQDKKKEKVIYKYKQYEKFDFEELSVAGEGGSPGDLTSGVRFQKEFKNKLPLKKDFTPEIRKSIDRVQ